MTDRDEAIHQKRLQEYRTSVLKEAADKWNQAIGDIYERLCPAGWDKKDWIRECAAILADTAPLRPEDTYPPECGQYVDPKDWVEDFKHENGNYQNLCINCDSFFAGHKRRNICKECAEIDDPCAESVDGRPVQWPVESLHTVNKSRDWTENFHSENGNYQNMCSKCGFNFYGHKRRAVCKECSKSVDVARNCTTCIYGDRNMMRMPCKECHHPEYVYWIKILDPCPACAESVDGKPGNGECGQCREEQNER